MHFLREYDIVNRVQFLWAPYTSAAVEDTGGLTMQTRRLGTESTWHILCNALHDIRFSYLTTGLHQDNGIYTKRRLAEQ